MLTHFDILCAEEEEGAAAAKEEGGEDLSCGNLQSNVGSQVFSKQAYKSLLYIYYTPPTTK